MSEGCCRPGRWPGSNRNRPPAGFTKTRPGHQPATGRFYNNKAGSTYEGADGIRGNQCRLHPRGDSRGAGTAHAQRRPSALQRADHRGLSNLFLVAFTWSKMLASAGRSLLAGDFVGARSAGRPGNGNRRREGSQSPASGLLPPSPLSRSGKSLLAVDFVGARSPGSA